MPRTSTESLASTGRESHNIRFITTAEAVMEDWMQEALAARLELVAGEDFTVNGISSADEFRNLLPIQWYTTLLAVANRFSTRLENVLGKNYKVVVSIAPRPDEDAENDWDEYASQTTPEDEGGRAKKATKAQRREIDTLYVAVVKQG